MNTSDYFDKQLNEKLQQQMYEDLYRHTELTTFDMFKNFTMFTPRLNLARFLVYYELFKKVINIPGGIVDIGVYNGASLFTFAKLCEIFCPTDIRKVVYGFDTFTGFPSISEKDGILDPHPEKKEGGLKSVSSIVEDIELAQNALNMEKHLKFINRIELVIGDIVTTLPEFIAVKGHCFKVALLHIDCDLYEPSMATLEHLVPRMVKGGVIVIDDYTLDYFGGETKAIDEYWKDHFGVLPDIRKFEWHSTPSGYIVVE